MRPSASTQEDVDVCSTTLPILLKVQVFLYVGEVELLVLILKLGFVFSEFWQNWIVLTISTNGSHPPVIFCLG